MPYKFDYDHIKLPPEFDRRRKLTDDDKQYINKLYHQEKLPIREIARIFEKVCSRRLIQFELFPERRELAKKLFIARRKDGRYKPTKEKWAKIMREHRHYKHKILKVNVPTLSTGKSN